MGKEAVSDDELLSRAEALVESGELKRAQRTINRVRQESAKKCFVQSRLYVKKKWSNEARKQLERAIALDPGNADYAAAYEELQKGYGLLESTAPADGKSGEVAECCLLGSLECCCTGACQAICDGCS